MVFNTLGFIFLMSGTMSQRKTHNNYESIRSNCVIGLKRKQPNQQGVPTISLIHITFYHQKVIHSMNALFHRVMKLG